MQTQAIAGLLLAALPLMGSPGPATLSLAAMGSAFGMRPSGGYLVGVIAGTASVLLMIATGVTGLVLAIPNVVPVLAFLAAGYILYLAFRIATAPLVLENDSSLAQPSMVGGFLLAIANPKAFVAIGAVYASSTIVPDNPIHDGFVKVVLLAIVIVVVNSIWLVLGAAFASLFRIPRTARLINVGFAILLVAAVGTAMVSS